MKFPVLLALGLTALAGSVAAETEGEKYQALADKARASAAEHNARSEALSQQSEDLAADAAKFSEKASTYTHIADANEEAADAWDRYEEHRLDLAAHHASKDQVFEDFLAPKLIAASNQETAYRLAQDKLDADFLAEEATHLATKSDLLQAISDAEDALAAARAALDAELQRFDEIKAATHQKKVELAEDNQVWIDNHETTWNKKTEEWNAEWDRITAEKQALHDSHFGVFTNERDEADAANAAYECAKRFNDDEAQGKPLFFLKENVTPPSRTNPNARTIAARGGWNTVHAEFVSRSLEDGEKFGVNGNRQQTGVGICVEECGVKPGIRFRKNCVGFYGDVPGTMFTAAYDGNKGEVEVKHASTYRGNNPSFKYNKGDNCVVYRGSSNCIPLPDHFKDQPLRAVGQVWNSGTGSIAV